MFFGHYLTHTMRTPTLLITFVVFFVFHCNLSDYAQPVSLAEDKQTQARNIFFPNQTEKERTRDVLRLLEQVHRLLPAEKDIIVGHDNGSNYMLIHPYLNELSQTTEESLPVLAEFINSPNYLFTRKTIYGGNRNNTITRITTVTLGEVARHQFLVIVDPVGVAYKPRKGTDGKLHPMPNHFTQGKRLEKWWEENKDKTLLQMQSDILDYYIEHEKKIGFPNERDEEFFLDPLLEKKARLPIIKKVFLYRTPHEKDIDKLVRILDGDNSPIDEDDDDSEQDDEE